MNVGIEPLDAVNWYQVCQLSVSEEQKKIFAVPNVYWIGSSRYEEKNELFAIKLGNEYVGLIGGGLDEDGASGLIEPIMVDHRYQQRGIAEQALKLMVQYLAKHFSVDKIYIEHKRNNHAAAHVFEKAGFKVIGEDEEGFRRCMHVEKHRIMQNMKIVDFTREHIHQATALALANYEEERAHAPALPQIDAIPDLTGFADNGLGVAAFDGGEMVGFMCCYEPYGNAFGSAGDKGIFSPMGGNAAIPENRAKIYAAMYQAAAEKWVRAGAVSHAVSLYAHDRAAQEQFFRYGFGLRCVDAVRSMEPVDCATCEGYEFAELAQQDYPAVHPLALMLNDHERASPFFMNRPSETFEDFISSSPGNSRFFGAKYQGELCAFLSLSNSGETFITEREKYKHVNGAFCLPEHRGKNAYQNLMNHAISTLKSEGFTRLGVDFESFNPAAYGFWLKYFTAYAHSIVRRIDANILACYKKHRKT